MDWTDTALWKELQRRDQGARNGVDTLLEQEMPRIQAILAAAATSPSDFTLHDAAHSYRVAERMADIIPQNVLVELSSYELALGLLSAYLHDIGMTPEQRHVRLHYNHLLTGDKTDLAPADIEAFQNWLDSNGTAVTPPLCATKPPTTGDLILAKDLVAQYCRARHNDWSAAWIGKHLSRRALGSYQAWTEDLIRLCQSHHFGKDELVREEFDPRYVGSPARVVHLRYLACVLRVADILDFDPERTPEIVFTQRDITPSSVIFWYKDHDVSLAIDSNQLSFWARPKTALVHRALQQMADEIEGELRLCRDLDGETDFARFPGVARKLPHRWRLEPTLSRDIKARDNAYTFIDGSFRPNTTRLLELLSGTPLYGEPLAAVRELLQNAFDAVREQIAYLRLRQRSPSDETLSNTLGIINSVTVSLESDNGSFWLRCSDTGVGMTRQILTNHLLVSGQPRRADVVRLERRCQDAGFRLARTGQFGVGVLSYFMISDLVQISTRRSIDTGDAEQNGWSFETEGIGSFGELRHRSDLPPGTTVRLRLKDMSDLSIQVFEKKLLEYLREVLAVVPCQLSVRGIDGRDIFELSPGWARDARAHALRAIEWGDTGAKDASLHATSMRTRQEREQRRTYRQNVLQEAETCMSFRELHGELPGDLGRFRVILPIFELKDGASTVFFLHSGTSTFLPIVDGNSLSISGTTLVSWKGMTAEPGRAGPRFHSRSQIDSRVIVEIDFESSRAGDVNIARTGIALGSDGTGSFKWLARHIQTWLSDILKSLPRDAIFYSINQRLLGAGDIDLENFRWMVAKGRSWACRNVDLPITTSRAWRYRAAPRKAQLGNQSITVVQSLCGPNDAHDFSGLRFFSANLPPDRIAAAEVNPWNGPVAVPIWSGKSSFGHVPVADFPPNWSALAGILFVFGVGAGTSTRIFVCNRDHELVRGIDIDSWKQGALIAQSDGDPLSFQTEILEKRAIAAAWLLNFVSDYDNGDRWTSMGERDTNFVASLWLLLFGAQGKFVFDIFVDDGLESSRYRIRRDGWVSIDSKEQQLPTAPEDWRITYARTKTAKR